MVYLSWALLLSAGVFLYFLKYPTLGALLATINSPHGKELGSNSQFFASDRQSG